MTLPSRGDEDVIPTGLDGVHRFTLSDYSPTQVEPLIRLLTGQPQYPASPVGEVPQLAPAVELPIISEETQAPADVDDERVAGERSVREIDELLGARKQALKRIPPPEAGEGPHLPWWRAWHQLSGEIAALEQERAAADERERPSGLSAADSVTVVGEAPRERDTARSRAEPSAVTERDLLDAAIPTPGGPDHRMLYDGSLLHRVIAQPAPASGRGPRGSDMPEVLEEAATAVYEYGQAHWKSSADGGLYREVRREWRSPGPRIWQVGWTTADTEEPAKHATAAAAISTRPFIFTFERTYPTTVQLDEGRGVCYAAHDLEIVRDTAATVLFAGMVAKAAGHAGHMDLLTYVGAAPTDQPLVPSDSYAPSNAPFDEPSGRIVPNPPFGPTRYMDLLRVTPDAMGDAPEEVALALLDDWLATFRTRDVLIDLRS